MRYAIEKAATPEYHEPTKIRGGSGASITGGGIASSNETDLIMRRYSEPNHSSIEDKLDSLIQLLGGISTNTSNLAVLNDISAGLKRPVNTTNTTIVQGGSGSGTTTTTNTAKHQSPTIQGKSIAGMSHNEKIARQIALGA